jgi:hypothetical protein
MCFATGQKISSLYFNLIHYHINDTFFANNIIDTLTYIMDVMFIIKQITCLNFTQRVKHK